MHRVTSENGINFIANFEGLRLKSYLCPAGVWTIGYGHTLGVKPGQVITKEQAIRWFKQDLLKFESVANRYTLNQHQFDALVSFLFNCGTGALNGTKTGALLKNGNLQGFADALLWWNKVDGKALPGLSRRRQAERKLFLTGAYK